MVIFEGVKAPPPGGTLVRVEKCGAAACGECGVRALFEKVRPHEKKCGECGEIQPKSYKIIHNIGSFGQFLETFCELTGRHI